MKLILAADHAGFEMKEALKAVYAETYEIVDVGANALQEGDDYPPYMHAAARLVAAEPDTARAILFGGSGQGEAMVANRHTGVRAVVYYGGSEEIITLSREHNDANVLSLGARFLTHDEAIAAARVWLATPFSQDERHVRRIGDIDAEQ